MKKGKKQIVTAWLMTLVMVFSLVMVPGGVAKAESDEKAGIRLRKATGVSIDGNTATITYEHGTATVSGDGLEHEQNDQFNYGDNNFGTMHVLKTESTALTFTLTPDEGYKAYCWVDGQQQEMEDNSYTVSGLAANDDAEVEFTFESEGGGGNNPNPGENGRLRFLCQSQTLTGGNIFCKQEGAQDFTEVPPNAENNGYESIELAEGTFITIRLVPKEGYQLDTTRGVTLWVNGEAEYQDNGQSIGDFTSESGHTFDLSEYDISNSSVELEFGWENANGEGSRGGGGGRASHQDQYDEYTQDATATVTISGGADFYLNGTWVSGAEENTQSVTYKYDDSDKVEFEFECFFIERYTSVSINGVSYNKYIPGYDDDGAELSDPDKVREEAFAAIALNGNSQTSGFIVTDVPKADAYTVTVERRFMESEDAEKGFCPVGNFLWTAEENAGNSPEGNAENPVNELFEVIGEGEADASLQEAAGYVKYDQLDLSEIQSESTVYLNMRSVRKPTVEVQKTNDTIDTVEVTGSEGNYTASFSYNTDIRKVIITLDEEGTMQEDCIAGGRIEMVSASYDGKTYEYQNGKVTLAGSDNVPCYVFWDQDENGDGAAMFPEGTSLTVRLIPDYGKQLVAFGVNGGTFEAGEDVSTYTFEIHPGNFHLNAHFESVDDVVKAGSEKVATGSIALAEGSLTSGSAQLTVNDVTLSPDKIKGFEDAAEGYSVSDYLDIDLYHVTFKGNATKAEDGTWTPDGVWSDKIDKLENKATITIQLEDGINAEDIIIVHNIHDGNEYEIIPIESYDAATHTITFKTNSFSNYAIGTKTAEQSEAEKKAEEEKKAAEAKAAADQKAADTVILALNSLPASAAVTTADEQTIAAARKAYNALTDDQKKLVSAAALKKLTDAEAALDAAKQAAGSQTPAAKGSTVASKDTKDTSNYVVTNANASNPTVEYSGDKNKSAKSVSIPATVTDANGVTYKVTKIADGALSGNKTVTTVTMGANITTIGKNAFKNCTKLSKVTVGKGVTEIGSSAFNGCKKLKTVSIGAKVTTIGDSAFAKCSALTKVTIPKKVTKVGKSAFNGCTKLKTVSLGANVESIGDSAFAKCSALTKVTVPSKVNKIGKNAFDGCKKLKTLTIKSTKLSSKNVSKNAFKGITSGTVIKVPKSKKSAYIQLFRKKGLSKKVKIK